jgi:hypothetical protein
MKQCKFVTTSVEITMALYYANVVICMHHIQRILKCYLARSWSVNTRK